MAGGKIAPTKGLMGFGGKKSLYILTEERAPKYYIFAAELSKLANYD